MKPPDRTRAPGGTGEADEVDDLVALFAGVGAPRPLPEDFALRLELTVMSDAAGGGGLAFTSRPRPLPDDMRDRIEAAVLAATPVRTLPWALRRRLETRLARPRRQATARRALVAAGVLVLLATTAMFRIDQAGDVGDMTAGDPSSRYDGAGTHVPGIDAGAPPEAGQASGVVSGLGAAEAEAAAGGGRSSRGAAGGSAGYYYLAHPPPPYYYGELGLMEPLGEPGSGSGPQPLPPPQLAPLRIGVIGGDPVQEAGFRAYIDLLNAKGGAAGHRLDVVDVSSPATVATVNLSSAVVADGAGAPPGVRTPLIETLLAPESTLKGAVFSPAAVSERQAHLAVAAAGLPANGTAVVYADGQGPFAGRIPAAFEAALRARGTHVLRVIWDPARPVPFPPADAAFISLPPEGARTWLQAADGARYEPRGGIWGIWSLADESLVGDMSAAVQLLAPYAFPSSSEVADLEARAKQPASARLVHGWVAAKWLAVAVWQGADDSASLADALRKPGFESGFFPAYAVRPQTNSRTPEAVLVRPDGDRLVSEPDFRTDP